MGASLLLEYRAVRDVRHELRIVCVIGNGVQQLLRRGLDDSLGHDLTNPRTRQLASVHTQAVAFLDPLPPLLDQLVLGRPARNRLTPGAVGELETDRDQLYAAIFETLLSKDLVEVDDLVIFTKGDLKGVSGSTNAMKILEVKAQG